MLSAYLLILLPSLLVFLVMTVFSFGDGDASDPGDLTGSEDPGDASDHGAATGGILDYLTFRNVINYLLGFGAAGALAESAGAGPTLSAFLAVSGGAVLAILMYKFMAGLYSLAEDQTASLDELVGKKARVYIEVGPSRSRRGKVLVTLKSAQREFSALTDAPEPLPVHTVVHITAREGENLLVAPQGNDA